MADRAAARRDLGAGLFFTDFPAIVLFAVCVAVWRFAFFPDVVRFALFLEEFTFFATRFTQPGTILDRR